MQKDAIAASGLQDTGRRLEAVLDNASVAIILMDDRQQCIYMNNAAEHLTGFALEEVLELDRPLHDIIHHTHPNGTPFPLHECAIDRAFPEYNQTKGEEVFVHKDGGFYPVAFTASPVRDEASRTIGTIIEVRDVRDERRAAERQRLLINELNHRVKNTLATVQALARQSFRDADADAMSRFEGRLFALSKAHDVLSLASWHRASMRDIVTTTLRPFGAERIATQGPDCTLPPKAAVTVAMVLHELATNAVRHGALGVPAGSVSLVWNCTYAAIDTALELRWEEQGGPPVRKPLSKGFGMRLIERQLKLEYDGGATIDFAEAGLACVIHLRFPAHPDSPDFHLLESDLA